MYHRIDGSNLSLLLLALAVAGCTESRQHLTEPGAAAMPSLQSATPLQETERAALTELSKYVAMALQNDALRRSVKQSMHDAPFKEHKLELRKYLNDAMLAQVAVASRSDPARLVALLQSVRPLEFYMPVRAHRESWLGGSDLLVAAQLDDGEPIIAFNLLGEPVSLSEARVPAQPTFTIVPVETRFDQPVNPAEWTNVNDKDGEAIGTMIQCGPNGVQCSNASGSGPHLNAYVASGEESGGGSGSIAAVPGLYMTFSRIVDMGEPWTKGDPEIEVHVHGPVSSDNPQYGANLSCSGEHASEGRIFDQNNSFWNGSVLIFDNAQTDNFNALFKDGNHILFWEDDDTPCVIKTDQNALVQALRATVAAAGAAAVKLVKGSNYVAILGAFVLEFFDNASWLLSNDDYLGTLVLPYGGQNWYDANFTLVKGGNVNGRAQLVWR